MIFLPMVIIFCWTIPTCYRIYFYINNENVYILQLLCAVSAASKGFFTSALLIATNTVQMNFHVKRESNSLSHFRDSDQSNNPSDHCRNSSASGLSRASTSSFHNDAHSSQHEYPSTREHEHDDDDDDDYDRYLFRVPNDHERMSRLSSDSVVSVSGAAL
jgi:hypothetical protein